MHNDVVKWPGNLPWVLFICYTKDHHSASFPPSTQRFSSLHQYLFSIGGPLRCFLFSFDFVSPPASFYHFVGMRRLWVSQTSDHDHDSDWLQSLSQFLSPTSDIQTYSLVLNHFMFHLFPSSLFFSWTSEFCSSWIILFSSLSRTPPRYSAQYTHYITTSIVTFNISWLWSAECVWT